MMYKCFIFFVVFAGLMQPATAQQNAGIDNHMGNIFRLSDAQSRSISPENFKGEKGKGGMATAGTGSGASRELGQGWKVSPSVVIKSHTTFTIAEITGPGSVYTSILEFLPRLF